MFDRNIAANNTFGVTGNMHIARENPADASSKMVETVFEDLTAYKNRNGGIWGRGEMRTFRNVKLADNAIGYTQASGLAVAPVLRTPLRHGSLTRCSWAKPRTSATPATDAEKAYGRSLPKPDDAGFPDPRLRVLRLPS